MFKKMKKQNGEAFTKTIRDYHNGIFEIPNILSIVKYAGNTAQDAEAILEYLVGLIGNEKEEIQDIEDPFALLNRAGYNAFYADTLEKQNSIKHYFKPNEELCTFNDSTRFQNYYMIHAIKKNVDSILRKDFEGKEERQDLYGTSVISIQIAKRGGYISIKNRYNHTVSGCDNTFSSNPNNIIDGLSESLQEHFGVQFKTTNNTLPNNIILIGNQLFKFHQEISGISFGNHAYVKNGKIHPVLARNHKYLFDYFIFNARTKTFSSVIHEIRDSFAEDFNRVYGGKKSIYVKHHCIYDGDIMLIGV